MTRVPARRRWSRSGLLTLAGVSVVLLAGCTSVASVPVAPSAAPSASAGGSTPAPSASSTTTPCSAADATYPRYTRSYAPATDIAAAVSGDTFLKSVVQRGRLIVGVSADTRLFGARNPKTNRIEGFDIDILRAVAKAVLGDENKIEFRVITAAQRIPLLQTGAIDIVARTMSITCERWQQVAFSVEYLHGGQQVLVPLDEEGKPSVTKMTDLPSGSKVCAPKGSTSIDRVKAPLVPVAVAVHTDCLALLQEGKVDAITGDAAILAGFAAQDPYTQVVGDPFSVEPYGLAMNKENVVFVQVVNAVLEQLRSSGQLLKLWTQNGLQAALGAPDFRAPLYGR